MIVDYLQLMRADDPRAGRVEQVGQMSRGLKILARELDVPVIAISQLSRAPEQRHPPRPQLSDLRESGQIEQDADLVAFLYREDAYGQRDPDYEPTGLAEVIIAKHRNGPVGVKRLVFLDRFPKFADYTGQDQPIEQPAGEELESRRPRGRASRWPAPPTCARTSSVPARWASATGRAGSSAPRTSRGRASAAGDRLRRARSRGIASVIPRQVPRRLLRAPAGDRDRADGGARRALLHRGPGRQPRGRQGAVADGRHRDRQDDAGDAGLQDRPRGGARGGDLLAAEAAGADPPHLRRCSRPGFLPALFEQLTSVDLLHIDDLGAEKRTDWVLEQLYALINERYESQRSILVTTNLDEAALEEQIGARTVSRLVEICGDPLPLFGEDRRISIGGA